MKVSKLSDMANEKVQDKLGAEDGKVKERRRKTKKVSDTCRSRSRY